MRKVKSFLMVLCIILVWSGFSHAVELRIGVLKIEDAAPVVVAYKFGFFRKYGVNVKVRYFNSALERDAAFESHSIDCMITDPIDAILLKSSGYDVKIVSIALGVRPQDGVFSFLAAPGSNIKTLEELSGKTLAISKNSIIEYVADSVLDPKGIKVKKIDIRNMPLRVEMLLSGKVDAAVLPEPLATYARYKGAKLIFADSMLPYSLSQTVWVFRGSYLKDNPTVLKAFKDSYNEAVKMINADPMKYKSVITKIARVPNSILHLYKVPHYSYFTQISKKSYDRYLKWVLRKGLIRKPVPYFSIVYASNN